MIYLIKEKWLINLFGKNIEEYENERLNLEEVKKYIKNWFEGWEESAEENEYKIKEKKTDYKTFATCKIKTNQGLDIMRLKVIKRR